MLDINPAKKPEIAAMLGITVDDLGWGTWQPPASSRAAGSVQPVAGAGVVATPDETTSTERWLTRVREVVAPSDLLTNHLQLTGRYIALCK